MQLGRVIGCVWCTVKDARLDGHRLLVVQPLTSQLNPTGKRLICADCVGAGANELIYWTKSKESSFAFLPDEVPVDATVVAIVDSINLPEPPLASPTPPATRRPRKAASC